MCNLIIFEGIDNIGKTTLINEYIKNFNNPLIVKFSSPPKNESNPRYYQFNFFKKEFEFYIENYN
jgi:thymidylate kinase